MSSSVTRRKILLYSGHSTLARSLVSLSGYSARAQTSTGSQGKSFWAAQLADLERRVPQLMAETKTPGLAMTIIKDAKLVWHRAFGVKDSKSDAPVDNRTIFQAASMSKPVFAYAVMKLCERGVLDLDIPLTKYTSERFLKGDPKLDLITARHVLSHTSGFQNMRSRAEPLKIGSTPGEKWNYSGEGYAYLQSVVTKLTGQIDQKACGHYEAGLEVCATDMDEYMKANLLKPFGMDSSGYLPEAASKEHMAYPHDDDGKSLERYKGAPTGVERADVARYGAMGGLLTTAIDYAKFLIEVIDPKPGDAYRLSRASLKEMLRPQVKVEDGDGYSVSWALGWKVVHTAGGDLVGHGGDQRGFHSIAEISLADRCGFVILTNGDSGWRLLKELAPDASRWIHEKLPG